MARSAAAKKVAKAASTGAGGTKATAARSFLFPLAMAVVVVLGIGMIFVAPHRRSENAPAGSPSVGEHWHSAYQIYVCDATQATVYPADNDDRTGVHSHGDGLFHIHPFATGFSGQFATIGLFFEEGGWELSDSKIELPNGTVIDENDFQCVEGGENAEIRILQWNSLTAEDPIVFTENLGDINFGQNGQLYTLAVVDPETDNADIPRPDETFLRSYLGLEDQPLRNDDPSVEGGAPADDAPADDESTDDEPTGDEPAEDVPATTAGSGS
jgi:hypothetical protein